MPHGQLSGKKSAACYFLHWSFRHKIPVTATTFSISFARDRTYQWNLIPQIQLLEYFWICIWKYVLVFGLMTKDGWTFHFKTDRNSACHVCISIALSIADCNLNVFNWECQTCAVWYENCFVARWTLEETVRPQVHNLIRMVCSPWWIGTLRLLREKIILNNVAPAGFFETMRRGFWHLFLPIPRAVHLQCPTYFHSVRRKESSMKRNASADCF